MEAEDAAGNSSVLSSFRHALEHVRIAGTAAGMPHTRLIDRTARIWELRFGPYRVAYLVSGDLIVLLDAWRKKSQKLDAREVATAARYASEWRSKHG